MHIKHPIRPSTRRFLKEGRQVKGSSLFNQLHGYVYGRWIYFYIAMGTGRHPLAKRLAPLIQWVAGWITRGKSENSTASSLKMEDTYHGKVVPLAAAKQLVSVQEDIHFGDLEHVIPYAAARDIVLQNPDHIVVLDCPCRVASEHPCLPLDVCLIVGEPFAGFVLDHHPQRSRKINAQEAAEIIEAEDRRGHVHHAFFKDAMLGRFYAICNCCACCCGAMQAQRSGTQMLASSGYVAVVDTEQCVQCGDCVQHCQFSAIALEDAAVINGEECMGCGICVGQCQTGAIQLVRMESKGTPLEIAPMMAALKLDD